MSVIVCWCEAYVNSLRPPVGGAFGINVNFDYFGSLVVVQPGKNDYTTLPKLRTPHIYPSDSYHRQVPQTATVFL